MTNLWTLHDGKRICVLASRIPVAHLLPLGFRRQLSHILTPCMSCNKQTHPSPHQSKYHLPILTFFQSSLLPLPISLIRHQEDHTTLQYLHISPISIRKHFSLDFPMDIHSSTHSPTRPDTPPTVPTRKRIIKGLYKQLKKGQTDDVPIPAPTLFGIKFYIRNHYHASQIFIEDDPPSQDYLGQPPLAHPSNFILSQLEAQKIANITSPPSQVFAALIVTSKFLAEDPLGSLSYPTLLTWHTSEKHRTYCLFAYLTCPMESRVYSVSELLGLRDAFSSDNMLDTSKLNPDVGKSVILAPLCHIAESLGISGSTLFSITANNRQPTSSRSRIRLRLLSHSPSSSPDG